MAQPGIWPEPRMNGTQTARMRRRTKKRTSSELKITSSEGTILFDRDKGAVVESVSKLKIEGDLKTEINGMELPGRLSLTIESKSSLQP
jgi:hypothetical protein